MSEFAVAVVVGICVEYALGVSLTAEVLSGVSVVYLGLVGDGLAHILVAYAVNKAVGAHIGAFLVVAQL